MYYYPIDSMEYFSKLLTISPNMHTMGSSLKRYMEIKIHPLLNRNNYSQIVVQNKFDRSCGISSKEKSDKLFNYIRPTATLRGTTININCFPGIDYIFHYGNILKSYLALTNKKVNIIHNIPNENDCWKAIAESGLKCIPKPHTVIMGYVEGLQWISNDSMWQGDGNFLWKRVNLSTGEGILLGCKHTYWGEIAGRIVSFLAMNGVKRIIYSGKLGTLNPHLTPNTTIATGNSSILPNGKSICWTNIFENIVDEQVYNGVHITVPSVLQETNDWLNMHKYDIDFVDPEIGHMALAAQRSQIEFSYFHIISDNLAKKYETDLSNERNKEVIDNRKKLFHKMGTVIKTL